MNDTQAVNIDGEEFMRWLNAQQAHAILAERLAVAAIVIAIIALVVAIALFVRLRNNIHSVDKQVRAETNTAFVEHTKKVTENFDKMRRYVAECVNARLKLSGLETEPKRPRRAVATKK